MKPHRAGQPQLRTPLQRRLAIMMANWRSGPVWWPIPFFVLLILTAMMMVVVFWSKTTQSMPK